MLQGAVHQPLQVTALPRTASKVPQSSKGIRRFEVKCIFRSVVEFGAKLISILRVPAQNCKAK